MRIEISFGATRIFHVVQSRQRPRVLGAHALFNIYGIN